MTKELVKKIADMIMSPDEEMNNLGKEILYRNEPTEENIRDLNHRFAEKQKISGKPLQYVRLMSGSDVIQNVWYQGVDLGDFLLNAYDEADIFSVNKKEE